MTTRPRMDVQVEPVAGAGDLDDFLRLPYRLYADEPHYVFPLLREQKAFFDPGHNPFFAHADTRLWLARRRSGGGRPRVVGRVGACVDRYHNEHSGEKTGFFGFFECEDDPVTACALLDAARGWVAEHGMEILRGPASFTTNHDYLGLLVDGYDKDPVVGMPYQPPYYATLLEDYGLYKAMDLYAWDLDTGGTVPEKLQRFMDRIMATATFTIRPFRMDRFWEDASIVREIYNEAWSRNWGFIPLDDAEFAYLAKDMKSMVDPSFLLIAENDEGRPIGFALSVPDFNQALKPLRGKLFPFGWLRFLLAKRRIRMARTLLMGVRPEYRNKGVDAALVYRTMQATFPKGIARGECSWVLETNRPMNIVMRSYGGVKTKTYRIYEMPAS
ncbi:MAG: N-acetyltransferase [Candidatus Krumholzibacteriia bacterium]